MKRWIRSLSAKAKTTAMVLTLLTAQVAGAALPFMPSSVAHAAPTLNKCTTDTLGANDVPNQKDLTQLCSYTGDAAGQMTISWQWDDISWSGNNSGDACALFDTDGDGNINKAVCVSVKGSPATQVSGSPIVYTCNDTDVDNCKGAVQVANATTTCAVSQVSTDPFPADDFYPQDMQALCTVTLADVGNGEFKDVCSYPSFSTPSDPSDCVVAVPGEAKLEVVKSLVPSSDSGRFDLKIDGTTHATNVGDTGSTGTQIVTAANNNNTHTIAELANSTTNATSLSSYTTSVICKDQHGQGTTLASGTLTDATLRQLSVTVAPDSDVLCTFTNTRQAGTLQVIKDVINDNGGTKTYADFHFSVNGGTAQSFDATTSPDGAKSVSLPTGTYSVTEPEANSMGYSTSYNNCSNVSVTAGQTTICTITNNDVAPTLTLNKVVNNTHGGTATAANFQGLINGSNVTWGTANTESAGVAYNLTEMALAGGAGYAASSWSCNGGSLNGNQITLSLGQNVTCTITNSDVAPQLTIKKHVVNNYGGQAVASNFTMNVTGTNVSNSSFAGSEAGTTVTLNAGNYSVGESGGPAGYTGSNSADCSGTIAVGQTKTCTITNSDNPATISGHKFDVNANATQGSGGTPIQNWTVYLLVNGQPLTSTTTDANGNYSFTGLSWGNYTLAECQNVSDGCAGWTQIYGPSGVTVNGSQLTATNKDFGNFHNGSVSGFKWNDLNGDGIKQENEPKLSGWVIFIDANGNSTLDNGETSTPTDANGNYTLGNLAPGTYRICEQHQAGWAQTFPANNGCYSVVIDQTGETNPNTTFGNQGRGTITVVKNVNDGFGNVSSNVLTWNWNINGSGNFATGSGNAQPVAAGTYTVTEVQKANYHVTASSCTGETTPNSPTTSLSATVSAGENVVCTFTNTRDTGNLTINKVLVPSNDSGLFNLQIDGSTAGTGANVGNGGTTGSVLVTTGTHTVSEVAGTGTNLADYSSTYSCSNNQSGSGTSVQVNVTTNNAVTCTFTNVRYGHVVVQKVTNPSGSNKSFTFTSDYNQNSFNLTDGQSNTSPNLLPGSYAVAEASTTGWDLTSATCDDGSLPGAINLSAGETVTCTFVNTQRGSVHGTKTIVNANGTTAADQTGISGVKVNLYSGSDNTGTLVGTTTTDSNGDYSFTNLLPGDYFVEEVVPAGATQISGGGSFTIDPGEDETANSTVDFGNFLNGSISGYKFNDINGNGVRNDGEPKLADWTITLSQDGSQIDETKTDQNGNYSFSGLVPGTYEVCEVPQDGWVQTSDPECYSITIDQSGESDQAVFGNQGRANITIVKNVDDGFGNITSDVNTWTWAISGDNYGDSGIATGTGRSDIPAGEYTINEDPKDDYHFTSVTCDNDAEVTQNETFSLTLNPGDDVTCTFTNTRDTGTVQVNKFINPSDDEGLFNLNIVGPTSYTKTDQSDGGSTGNQTVVTGTYHVSETAGTDTDLSDYDSSYICIAGESLVASGEGTVTPDFSVTSGRHVGCTFTNVRHAHVTIVKKAFPFGTSQTFTFTLNQLHIVLDRQIDEEFDTPNFFDIIGGTTLVKNFVLDDNNDPALPNHDTSSLSPGTYTVTEAATTGWNLVDLDCGESDVTINGATVTFTVAAGEDLLCTYTNQKPAPQVLGATTILTNTGLPLIAYSLTALTLLGTAVFIVSYRRPKETK